MPNLPSEVGSCERLCYVSQTLLADVLGQLEALWWLPSATLLLSSRGLWVWGFPVRVLLNLPELALGGLLRASGFKTQGPKVRGSLSHLQWLHIFKFFPENASTLCYPYLRMFPYFQILPWKCLHTFKYFPENVFTLSNPSLRLSQYFLILPWKCLHTF